MQVDFNNVRRQALAAYGGLVRTLKDRTDETGRITVERREIENDMENLRYTLVTIALTYEPDDPEFQDVLGDEIVPSLCDEDEAEAEKEQ